MGENHQLQLAGGPGVEDLVQTDLAHVLLRWKVFGLNDPQFEHVLHPPAVVLGKRRTRESMWWSGCMCGVGVKRGGRAKKSNYKLPRMEGRMASLLEWNQFLITFLL